MTTTTGRTVKFSQTRTAGKLGNIQYVDVDIDGVHKGQIHRVSIAHIRDNGYDVSYVARDTAGLRLPGAPADDFATAREAAEWMGGR